MDLNIVYLTVGGLFFVPAYALCLGFVYDYWNSDKPKQI